MLHLCAVDVNDVHPSNRDAAHEQNAVDDTDRDPIVMRVRVRRCSHFALLKEKRRRAGGMRKFVRDETEAFARTKNRSADDERNRTFKKCSPLIVSMENIDMTAFAVLMYCEKKRSGDRSMKDERRR